MRPTPRVNVDVRNEYHVYVNGRRIGQVLGYQDHWHADYDLSRYGGPMPAETNRERRRIRGPSSQGHHRTRADAVAALTAHHVHKAGPHLA